MAGINDIKVALQPHGVRSVTMRYDGSDQLFTVELADRTMEVRAGSGVVGEGLIAFIKSEIGRPVETMPDLGPKLGLMSGLMSASDGQVSAENPVSTSAEMSAPTVSELEHKGEIYELAHDGAPKTLFF